MEELLMCSVCIERYCEKMRHPVLLPRCGHSFCRSCVAMLVSGGCIVCPTCRTDQKIDSADKLPTEYTLLAIIGAQESNKKETCERHFVKLSFWCRTCSISTCGECLFEDHPTHSHEVIRASKYINDMKLNAQEVANKFMEALDNREQIFFKAIFDNAKKISSALCSIGVLRKDMEEARELMKGIKEEESITAATALSEAAKFLGLKWNIQDANYARKVKEENERKQKDIEEREANAKREKIEAEAKVVKTRADETEAERKARKEARRLLRKSRTMSSVEMCKETEKIRVSNKDVGTETESIKEKLKGETEATNSPKEAIKTPVNTVKEEPTEIKCVKQGEEAISVGNIAEHKGEKSIHDSEYKGEKIPDLAIKPKGRYIMRKLPNVKKSDEIENNKKRPVGHDLLPVIQENDVEKLEGATAVEIHEEKSPNDKKSEELKVNSDEMNTDKIKSIEEKKDNVKSEETNTEKVKSEEAKKENVKSEEAKIVEIKAEEANIVEIKAEANIVEIKAEEIQAVDIKTEVQIKEVIPEEETQMTVVEIEVKDAIADVPSDPLEEKLKMDGKLTDFIQVPGFMISVESADGRLAGMEWGPQGLHVHCLQYSHVSYDIVIKSTILNSMIPSKNPIVFLELSADQTILGRVYIKLSGHLRRAHNFLSLCLGEDGKCLLNTKFLQVYNVSDPGERILGGDYEHNNGRGGRGLLTDLEWNGDYAVPMKAGMITAAGSGQDATNSLFLLCTQSDPTRNFSCPFGMVCEGLKIVKDAVQQTATKQVWITDCGVVIVPPRFDYGQVS